MKKNLKAKLSHYSIVMMIAGAAFTVRADNDTNAMPDTASTNNDQHVDNSGINQRDRNGQTETAFQQGNSHEDIRLTKTIRRSVVNETNNFSVLAHNIKIITLNGKVTLRGPVKTEDEKARIETIAQDIAGPGNVNNLLEVKNNQ